MPGSWTPCGSGAAAEAGAGSPRARRAAELASRTFPTTNPPPPARAATAAVPPRASRKPRRERPAAASVGRAEGRGCSERPEVGTGRVRSRCSARTPTIPATTEGTTSGSGPRVRAAPAPTTPSSPMATLGGAGATPADQADDRREDQQDDRDAADEDRLVRGPEGPDGVLLGGRRGRVDEGGADRQHRGGGGVGEGGHQVTDPHGGAGGQEAAEGAQPGPGLGRTAFRGRCGGALEGRGHAGDSSRRLPGDWLG